MSKFLVFIGLIFIVSCFEKKEPEIQNGVVSLVGSPFTKIEGISNIVANGFSTSSIKITLVDSSKNPLVGLTPSFRATGSGNSYGICSPTNSLGVSNCSMTSTRAETKTLQLTSPENINGNSITFVPGPASRLGFSVQPSSAVLVGVNLATQPVVQVQDANGNPVVNTIHTITLGAYTDPTCSTLAPGTMNVTTNPLTTDGLTGIVSFSGVQYSKWETLYLGASALPLQPGCSQAISVTQNIDIGASSITATGAVANGVSNSTVTIQLLDTLSAPVVGFVPTFLATDTGGGNVYSACSATDGTGTSTCTMTSTKAETKTFSVVTPISFSGGSAVFSPGPISNAHSTIVGSDNIIANGTATSAITITLRDANSNGVSGQTPSFSATDTGSTNTYNACSASDANGVSTCTMSSTKAEVKSLLLSSPVTVTGNNINFINGPLSTLSFKTQPSANGLTGLNLTTQPIVEGRDAFNNLVTVPESSITLSPFSDGTCSTAAGGVLSVATNPVVTTNGESAFAGVNYNTAGTIYIGAQSGGVKACSNSINVTQRPSISYSKTILNENPFNIGTITEVIILTLSDYTFAGANGNDFISLGWISVANLPTGINAIATRNSANQLTISFNGSAANHENVHDINNVSFTFGNNAFSLGNASTVLNYIKSDIAINFLDAYTLSYSGSTLHESISNIGSISETLSLTLSGTTLTGSDTENFIQTGKATVGNLPSGLTPVLTRVNSTQLTLSFNNSANNHSDLDDITNFTLTFQDTAFTSGRAQGVTNYIKNDISIDFLPPASLSYDVTAFTEAPSNIGEISNNIVITLSNDTFVADLTGTLSILNIPGGLVSSFTRDSDTQVTISLTGQATNHMSVNDVSNVTVNFTADAFTNNTVATNVINNGKSDISINFNDPASLSYGRTTFNERTSNDGGIDETSIITLAGDTFAASLTGHITATNVPSGLSANFTRINDTQVLVNFSGTAASHTSTDGITNLTFTFSADAFVGNTVASNVINHAKNDLIISFNDPPVISYDTATFSESVGNDGSISNSIVISLSGDNFAADITGDISVSNLPAGLSVSFVRDSDTQITVSLNNNATAHANVNDINNLTFTFQDQAFEYSVSATLVTNYSKNDLIIDFQDPASISYSSTSLNEAASNTGMIDETITFTLTGDTFDTDLTGDIVATNVPSGLSAVFTRNSDTQVTLSFTGTANNHSSSNNIGNLTITFQNNAFTGNIDASNVVDSLRNDIAINFSDPASITYSTNSITEDSSNTGTLSDTIVLNLAGDSFDSDINGDIVVSNVPAGLNPIVTRNSNTQVTVSFGGTAANHENSHDISNLTITCAAAAFLNNTDASNVLNSVKSDISIDFNDAAFLSYSSSTVSETLSNTGAISDTIVITLTNDTFVTDITGRVSASNVPTGLTALFTRNSDTQVTLSFSGVATNHENVNDISNFTVTFLATAFTNNTNANNVTDSLKSDISVDFSDAASLSYSTSILNEGASNTGQISETLIITLTNDTFVSNLSGFVSVSNVPGGLTEVITRDSSNQVTISFSGNATSHENINDIANLTVTFLADAFTNNTDASNVLNSVKNNIGINFIDSASLSYSVGTLNESTSNAGGINETIVITLTGDVFEADLTGDIQASNVPSGLNPVFTRNSDTQITFSLTGNADSHANANDIGNLTISFLANAFAGNTNAANVTGSTKNDIVVNFLDPATLSYNVSSVSEVVANTGAISETFVITLANDIFEADLAGDITALNVPAGLTALFTRNSDTQVTLSFSGNANDHTNADDISNLTVNFSASAFSNNTNAANVVNSSRSDLSIDFQDAASLSYSAATFTEVTANTGAISDTIVITLANDTFDTDLNGDVSITNVPSGLTETVTRNNSTQVTISLSGSAVNHENINDVSNLTITFAAAAFVNNTNAANVTNSSRSDIAIDFNDKASMSYSTFVLNEVIANTGAINESIIITLANDTFSSDLTGDITASNVPSGLVASFTRDNDNQVTFSLTGTANNHENVNDISNLTVSFSANAFTNNTVASNVTNSVVNTISLDFINAASLSYNVSTLNEAITNVGEIAGSFVVTLSGDTFPADLTGDISFGNVPVGLNPIVTRNSNTQVTISFSNQATNHSHTNDVGNLTINFLANAFTNNTNASNVTNSGRNDLVLDFKDPDSLSYSGNSFSENVANNGSVTDTIVITLNGGDTFVSNLNGNFAISNFPSGLSPVLTRDNDTQVTLSFSGNANPHTSAEDVNNLTLEFFASAFVGNTNASNVTNSLVNNLTVSFLNPIFLTFSTDIFDEEATRTYDSNTVAIYEMNEAVGTSIGKDSSVNSIDLSPVGNGTAEHSDIVSQFGFLSYETANTYLESQDVAEFNLGDSFTIEGWVYFVTDHLSTSQNHGLFSMDKDINNRFQIIVKSDGTVGLESDVGVSLSSTSGIVTEDIWHHIALVVDGFGNDSWKLYVDGTQVVSDDFGFNWGDTSHTFRLGVDIGNSLNRIEGFFDEFRISNIPRYSSNFTLPSTEFGTLEYVGRIENTITISIVNGTFSGLNDDDFINDGKVLVTNLPEGLTASLKRKSETELIFSLAGEALSNHHINDDISNLTIEFYNNAFNDTLSSQVENSLRDDLQINFKNEI